MEIVTKAEWIAKVEANKHKLITLIAAYHPVSLAPLIGMKITAPNAEAACEVVRDNIRKNFEGNPATEFQDALREKNISRLMNLMSDAWFGVPESTDCWKIPGFKEAVDLMDDPPND